MPSEKQVNKETGEVKTASPFSHLCARTDGYQSVGVDYSNPIVIDYKRVKTVKKTGDKETDFIILEKTIEAGKRNLTEIANSYKDETDIYKIMDKVRLTGDLSIMTKNMANSLNDGDSVVDVSTMPHDLIEAHQMVEQGEKAYRSLPDDLKNGATKDEIATKYTQKEIDAYIATLQKAKEVAPYGEVKKEGEN